MEYKYAEYILNYIKRYKKVQKWLHLPLTMKQISYP